jgi:predicted GTPase
MAPQRLTVVLVGQTGNGKSATGNSLLGVDAFQAKRSLASVTERCQVGEAMLDACDAPMHPSAEGGGEGEWG